MRTDKEFFDYLDAVVILGTNGLIVKEKGLSNKPINDKAVIEVANEIKDCMVNGEFNSDLFFNNLNNCKW